MHQHTHNFEEKRDELIEKTFNVISGMSGLHHTTLILVENSLSRW